MIHIERNRIDENGNDIKPSDDWFEKAAYATNIAIEQRENHEADGNIYGSDEVRAALEKLFYDKCAYCESKISGTHDWNVEHFRPKGRVAERPDHTGYYWLTYDWNNLYPACTHCNQRRKDKPRWGDLRYANTGGKADQFPLEDEQVRAMHPTDEIANEKNLLLDPCKDNIEKCFTFDITGDIHSLDNNGEATIEICHLKRRRLKIPRRDKINLIIGLLTLYNKLSANSDALTELKQIIEMLLSNNCEFAGTVRYVNNNKEEFPII